MYLPEVEMPWFCIWGYFQYKYRRSSNQADEENIEYLIDKLNETVSATLEMELRRKSSPKRPIKPLFYELS